MRVNFSGQDRGDGTLDPDDDEEILMPRNAQERPGTGLLCSYLDFFRSHRSACLGFFLMLIDIPFLTVDEVASSTNF